MKAPIDKPGNQLNNATIKPLNTDFSHKAQPSYKNQLKTKAIADNKPSLRFNSKPHIFQQPRRLPARSIKEIRHRRLGDSYHSPMERLVYALLSALLYGFVGLLLDLAIVLVRSLFGIGSGEMFWLFAPFLLLLGLIIGFISGKNSGAYSMDALPTSNTSHLDHVDDASISHDIFRGLGIGIFIFAIMWLIMMVMM